MLLNDKRQNAIVQLTLISFHSAIKFFVRAPENMNDKGNVVLFMYWYWYVKDKYCELDSQLKSPTFE